MQTELDRIIQQSLMEFIEDIFNGGWYGKEREAVSLYAFGYLCKRCQPNTVLCDPKQIGIEVRVPKPHGVGKKVEICKDLVIWREPYINCWDKQRQPTNYPLAVLEWKVSHRGVYAGDVDWLCALSVDCDEFVGYAICLDLTERKFRLSCTRVHNGLREPEWLVLKK